MSAKKVNPKSRASLGTKDVRQQRGHAVRPYDEKTSRKNFYLYQSKIDQAKEILGAKSETDAIDAALDLVIFSDAMAQGTEAMVGEEYVDVLGIADELHVAARARK